MKVVPKEVYGAAVAADSASATPFLELQSIINRGGGRDMDANSDSLKKCLAIRLRAVSRFRCTPAIVVTKRGGVTPTGCCGCRCQPPLGKVG
ncbi:hypothetical protein J6590_055382 [Homalodisca vitripennis]|nr:hypothetical protein J6590_055382 [Homalodisca vitripennis]